MKLALLLIVLAGCSGLDPLEPACGNGVIEPGEDCDSGKDCRSCSIVCSQTACPEGYACGVDELCHAPGGAFHQQPSALLSYSGLGFGITDIDHDGYGDVIALGGTSFAAHLGDAAGTLARTLDLVTPSLRGAPSVSYLDDDTSLDLILPTADGLLAYTSRYSTPSPYPFPIVVGDDHPGEPTAIETVALDDQFVGIVVDDRAGHLSMAVVDGDLAIRNPSSTIGTPQAICGQPGFDPAQLDPKQRDTYRTGASSIISLTTATGKTCVIEVENFPSHAIRSAVATGAMPGTRAVLAAIAPSECPSLVYQATNGATGMIPGTGSPASCALLTASARTYMGFGPPVGHIPLVPAIAGYGADAVAFLGGVAALSDTGSTAKPMFTVVRPLSTMTAGDVDGDGDIDGIGTSDGFANLDVLRRSGDLFLEVGVDSLAPPHDVVAADFDGDGLDDIVYAEPLPVGERVMLVVGGHDGLHPPQLVSTYDQVVSTAAFNLRRGADPGGLIADLFVVDKTTAKSTLLLTVLYGSPQRTLLPFFDPRATNETAPYSGAVTGVFEHREDDAPRFLDVVGILASGKVFLMRPTDEGALSSPITGSSPNLMACASPTSVTGCITSPRFVPYRAKPDDPDTVMFFEDSPQHFVGAFDPNQLNGGTLGVDTTTLPTLDPTAEPHQSYVVDGALYIGYSVPGKSVKEGAVMSCAPSPGGVSCHQFASGCSDAAPIHAQHHARFDPVPTETELLQLCEDSSTKLVSSISGPLLDVDPGTRYFEVADVTGDGVDDVVTLIERPGEPPLLAVYPQCTSRNLTECQ